MSVPTIAPDVLVEKLVALGAPEHGARLLVDANPDLALDVVNGDVCSPRTGPPVGPNGEVWEDHSPAWTVEHDPSCPACGGDGHPDGPCGYCATSRRG